MGSRPPLASGCPHLNHNPFHYVVPANVLSADQSRFLDDTRQDCGRGVAWAGSIRQVCRAIPRMFPRWLTGQDSEQPGTVAFSISWNELRVQASLKDKGLMLLQWAFLWLEAGTTGLGAFTDS